jgi:biotin operon repressor
MKDLKRKLLSKTIGKNSYWSLNKQLVRNLGLEATLILQHIIDLQDVFKKNEIFQAQPAMAEELGITEYAVKNRIVELSKGGYINIVKKGVPCKNYYSTNDDKIIDIIVNGLDHTKSTDLLGDYNNGVENDVSVDTNSTDLSISNEQTSGIDLISTITNNTNQEYITNNSTNNTGISYGICFKYKEKLLDTELDLDEYEEIWEVVNEDIGWDTFRDILNLNQIEIDTIKNRVMIKLELY